MHVILYLLFMMTIIINGSGKRMLRNRRMKSQNSPEYFSHDDFERFRSVREVKNPNDDFTNENSASMTNEDLIQDLETEKKYHGNVFPIQNNAEGETFLNKRTPQKKHHRRRKKKKKGKIKKGRRKGSKKHPSGRKDREEINAFNYQKGFQIQDQNLYNPKKLNNKVRRSKSKRFSSFSDIIEYLKSDQHSKVNENEKNCDNYGNKNFKDHIRHRFSNPSFEKPNDSDFQNNIQIDESKIREKRDKKQLDFEKIFSKSKRKSDIDSKNEDCEVFCKNKNLKAESCSCEMNKPVDFEKQLKILNKGEEEVETTKEKVGILSGIKNFLKNSLKNDDDKCDSLTTILNPHQYENQETTINNNDIVTTSEKNIFTTRETRSSTNFETSDKMIEYLEYTDILPEEKNSCRHSKNSTKRTTTEKEFIQTEAQTIKFHKNRCSSTTPVSSNSNQFCNNKKESDSSKDNSSGDNSSNDDSSSDKLCKDPLATFTLELKANPIAEKKGFRIRMKY